MRILLITARFFPESFSITNIALGLKRLGHQVTVLTGVPHYGKNKVYEGYENVRKQTYEGIEVYRVKERIRTPGTFGLIRNYLSIFKEYKRALKRLPCDFDIVFSHVMSPIFSISYVGKYCKKNNIPHFHYGLDLWPESLVATGYIKKNGLAFSIAKKYCRRVYKTCDKIAFASANVKQYFQDVLALNTPFCHIYQPCLTTPPRLETIRQHTYKKDGKLHILFCGTVARFNHLNLFIEALSHPSIASNVVFDVVGSGSELEPMKSLVAKLGLEKTVIFHGRIPSAETVAYFINSDVLFVPLYWNSVTSEMIPQKLIEYFMYGRPILGMLRGEGRKLMNSASEKNVWADQTVDDLRRSVSKMLLWTNEEFEECGSDNRRFFDNSECFKLDFICKQIETELKELVEKNQTNGYMKGGINYA